jgi:spore maturation protein CgeB
VLTNRISPESGIYELFTEDEDMAFYSDEEECLTKMNRLLNDNEYRNKLSSNLYNKITTKHMVSNRVDEVIKIHQSQK